MIKRVILERSPIRGHPQRISDFLGRWVGFQKSDITMLRQSLHCIKIGGLWEGRSRNGPNIGYPLLMAPYLFFKEILKLEESLS